jgi:hypothetical protein
MKWKEPHGSSYGIMRSTIGWSRPMLLPGSKLTLRNAKTEHKDHSRSSLKFLFHVCRFPSSGSRSTGKPGSTLRLPAIQSSVESISGSLGKNKSGIFQRDFAIFLS